MNVFTASDKLKFIQKAFGPGTLGADGVNFAIWCPVCCDSNKQKRKLIVKIDNDFIHCWVCGYRARSLFPLLKKYSTSEHAREYVDKFMSASEAERRKKNLIIIEDGIKKQFQLPSDFKLCANFDSQGKIDPDQFAVQRYVIETRGFSERDLWFYKIGYSNEFKWHRRALMPSFDKDGNLNYLVGRAIDSVKKRKYDAPNLDKNPIIFNEINIDWSQRLVLCEGPFDLTKCGDNAVPILGSNINEESLLFERILVNKTPIALALDSDMFETKTQRFAKLFSEYDIDVTIVDVGSYGKKDPGEMSKEEFKDALGNAKSYDWYNFMTHKLSKAAKTFLSL